MLNIGDNNGKTPLHLAAEYKNFSLANDLITEMKVDTEFLTACNGLSPLHLLSNAKVQNAVFTMEKFLDPIFKDDESRLAFKAKIGAVMKECAKIAVTHGAKYMLEYFIEKEYVKETEDFHDLLKHAAKSFDHSAVDSLKVLLDRLDIITPAKYNKFFNDKNDGKGFAVLKIACELKNSYMVNAMLPIVNESAGRPINWFSKETVKLLSEHVPDVLLKHLDTSINDEVKLGFNQPEIIIDFRSIISSEEPPKGQLDFLQTEALGFLANTDEKEIKNEILLHPTVQLYIKEKWKKFKIPFVIISSIIHILLIASFNILVVRVFISSNSTMKQFESEDNDIHCSNEELESLDLWAQWILIIFTMILLLKEMFQMRKCVTYLKRWPRNFLQLYVLAQATFMFCICYFSIPYCEYETFLAYLFATGSLCSCILFTVDWGRIFSWEKYSQILCNVFKTSGKILMYYVPLLVGFAILFSAQARNSESFVLPQGFTKVLAMTIGDLDYNGLEEKMGKSSVWTLIFFALSIIGFILLVGIALFNVLIGIAVFDLKELLHNAKCREVQARLLLITEWEEFNDFVYKSTNLCSRCQPVHKIRDWMANRFILHHSLNRRMDKLPLILRPKITQILESQIGRQENDTPKLSPPPSPFSSVLSHIKSLSTDTKTAPVPENSSMNA